MPSEQRSFPFPYPVVFDAVVTALPPAGFGVSYADKNNGRVQADAGFSMASWGENITVQVGAPGPNETIVTVESSLKFGLAAWGKHKRNFEKIFNGVDACLRHWWSQGWIRSQ